jgi:acyl-CoA thioesterase I
MGRCMIESAAAEALSPSARVIRSLVPAAQSRRRPSTIRSALLAAALLAPVALAHADPICPDVPVQPVSVPHLRASLEADQDAVVVALGSSTTQSHLASDRSHSYPAVVQAQLSDRLTFAHVAVINRGIGGQDAAEEVARMDGDALAVRPALVIWQVGANGVLRHTEPEVFKHLVETGIRRLQSAKIDVVLMDNQRAPEILDNPNHAKLEKALADAAAETGVSLFSRERLMDDWQRAGYPYELFIGPDGLHHNDRGYACLGRALTQAIIEGLGPLPHNQPIAASDAGQPATPPAPGHSRSNGA